MLVAYHIRCITIPLAGVFFASGIALGGCATSTSRSLMDARAQAPAHSPVSRYPAVEDVPSRRGPAMTPDQQMKLQGELVAARDRQAAKASKQGESTVPTKP
jgi:hypothetical protein